MSRQVKAIYGDPTPSGVVKHLRGAILQVSSNKCVVLTEDRRLLQTDWPNAHSSPSGGAGIIEPPEIGQLVEVKIVNGRAHIDRQIPLVSPISDGNRAFELSDTGTPTVSFDAYGGMYKDSTPPDSLPGDKVWVGNQGQKCGILEGGAAILVATPVSAFRALQKNDTAQIFGRNLHIETGLGVLDAWNKEGLSGLDFVGGCDQATESGAGQDNWTVRASIGHNSGGLASVGFFSRQGEPLWQRVVGTDGSIAENIAGGVSRAVLGFVSENLGNGRSVAIPKGNDDLQVNQGSWRVVAGGEMKLSSGGKMSIVAGDDRFDSANRDFTLSAGRNMLISASGDLLTGTPLSKALAFRVSNGSVEFDVGNPINLDTQKTKSGFRVQTYLGDISFATAAGNVIIATTKPDSVMLGANGSNGVWVAPFGVVLWEGHLQAYMKALIGLLEGHVHGGPGTPPVGTPMSVTMALLDKLVPSLRVKAGL